MAANGAGIFLAQVGARIGTAEVLGWGFEANRNDPVLHTHDRYGQRLDRVDFHSSYHQLMETSVGAGLHCLHHEAETPPGGHVVRTALFSLMAQVEAGHGCPISMTSAALPPLAHQPDLDEVWRPRIVSRHYDRRFVPADQK